jgi:hypothetical protein
MESARSIAAVHAVQGIELNFERGEIFSLLGRALGLFGLAVWNSCNHMRVSY